MNQCTFEFGPVHTRVHASNDFYSWLDELLTVKSNGYKKFFNDNNKSILTGHLPYVRSILDKYNHSYDVVNHPHQIQIGDPDPRILSTPHHPDFTLKPFQVSTVRKMVMGMRGSLQLATGAGKTACYIATLKILEMMYGSAPSLTVVTVTNLANQMASRMRNAGLNARVMEKGQWGDADHVVCVVNGLYKMVERFDQRAMQMLQSRLVLGLDEAHHGSAEMCFTVATRCPALYRYMLSATLYANRANPYSNPSDMKIMGMAGQTLVHIPARFLWEENFTATPDITFIPMEWPDARRRWGYYSGGTFIDTAEWRVPKKRGKGKDPEGVEWELIVDNEYRNEFIRRIVYWTLCREPEAKFVILVQRLEHGRLLQRMLGRVGVRSVCCFGGNKVVKINQHLEQTSLLDKEEKTLTEFATGELRVLIGSSKFDEGQSFPLFTDLILAQAGKGGEANRRVYQRVGRALHSDLKVRVRDFMDVTHKMVNKQSVERLTALEREEYPVKVETPEECLWAIPGI